MAGPLHQLAYSILSSVTFLFATWNGPLEYLPHVETLAESQLISVHGTHSLEGLRENRSLPNAVLSLSYYQHKSLLRQARAAYFNENYGMKSSSFHL
jgi:hypothetical protein